MRRKPFGKLLPSAHAVDREFRVICSASASRAFRSQGPMRSAPTMRVIGAAFYIMSMDEGRVFWDPSTAEPDAGERGARSSPARSRRSPSCTRSIPKRSGSAISASPAIISRARSIAGPSSTAPPRPSTFRNSRRSRSGCRGPCRRRTRVSIVHGDYRLDNMIFHADRAAGAGGARLGIVDARRSAGRLHLSVDAVDHAGRSPMPTSRR